MRCSRFQIGCVIVEYDLFNTTTFIQNLGYARFGIILTQFYVNFSRQGHKVKENRIYIRGEFRESLGMQFFSPFQPEREFKVYKSCKCSQIICSRVH